jgi:hypothetical protein
VWYGSGSGLLTNLVPFHYWVVVVTMTRKKLDPQNQEWVLENVVRPST